MNLEVKRDPAVIALSCVGLIVVGGLVALGKLDTQSLVTFIAGLGLPSLLGQKRDAS